MGWWVLFFAATTAATALELVQPPRTRNVTDECYVFAEIWTPEFCQAGGGAPSGGSSGSGAYPGCQRPLPYWEYNLTIHGLWPQYTDTDGYPQVTLPATARRSAKRHIAGPR